MRTKLFAFLTAVAISGHCIAATEDHADIKAEITKRHDEAVQRLHDWIAQVSIAAENRGYPEGAEYMAKLARDAGFQKADVITTDGKPGVFATLDAAAPKTVGLYFIYDVKQFDPAEWTSSPTDQDRQLSKATADQRGRENDDRKRFESAQRSERQETIQHATLD